MKDSESLRLANAAWAALLLGGLLWEVMAARNGWPFLTTSYRRHRCYGRVALVYTWAHLEGVLPQNLDVFYLVGRWFLKPVAAEILE